MSSDNRIKKYLEIFAKEKSKENYIRLLDAFRYTDVLVPLVSDEMTEFDFGNQGVLKEDLKPDIMCFPKLNKYLMPVFSSSEEIPDTYKPQKIVFMHCRDWINLRRLKNNEGVIFNPFSDFSFILGLDQIKVLKSFLD